MTKNILALSSSRVGNSKYLELAIPLIEKFLGNTTRNIAFIPFASVDSYDEYLKNVQEALRTLPHTIRVVTGKEDKNIIEKCDAVMVGGGNTFKLLHHLYEYQLMDIIAKKIKNGTPYIGWSAGSNITGKTIGTTNDMPIIQPPSFAALSFFNFQINPHYINVKPEGHNGETRDQRLTEFLKVNPATAIVGLPEGTALLLQNNTLHFVGEFDGVIFNKDKQVSDFNKSIIKIGEDISFLL